MKKISNFDLKKNDLYLFFCSKYDIFDDGSNSKYFKYSSGVLKTNLTDINLDRAIITTASMCTV